MFDVERSMFDVQSFKYNTDIKCLNIKNLYFAPQLRLTA